MSTRGRQAAQAAGKDAQVAEPNTEALAQPAQSYTWLVLVYRIQSEPSRLRAAVWRRLKTLGAIYLQAGTVAMPWDAASERTMRTLHQDIRRMSGSSILLRCEALAGEAEAIDAFNAARSDEYGEIIRKCEDFLQQLEREHLAEHFTFAELEENEVDLVKLQKWLAKVRARDVFAGPGGQAAAQLLQKCEEALERYADRVYVLDAEVD
jgi:DNA-binding transcriptional regulator PaaX